MSAVIIPARYASTRFPGKILAEIGGIPMIIRVAKRCKMSKADRVIVVTDSRKVMDICGKEGIECVISPENIATGTDRVAFAAANIEDDIIINVQGDEPFIPAALVDGLIDGLESDLELDMITACTPFKSEAEARNTSAVKVVRNLNGMALYFSRYPIPYDRDQTENIFRYRHIGVYGFRRDFLFSFAKLERTPLEKSENLEQLRALENGVGIKVIETGYNSVSVDTPQDLKIAEKFLVSENP